MTDGLALGLMAAVCWGLTDVFAAVGGRRLGSLPTLAIAQFTSLLVMLAIGLAIEGRVPVTPAVAPQAALFGILLAIGYLAMFTGLAIGPVSVVSPAIAAYGGLTVILAVVFLGEKVTVNQWVGVAVGTLGVALTAFRFDRTVARARPVSAGVAIAVVAVILFAVASIGLAGPTRQAGWPDVIFVSRIASTAAVWSLLLAIRCFRPRGAEMLMGHVDEADGRTLGIIAAAGILDMAGAIAFGIGLTVSLAWIVALASSFGPAVAVLVAVALLGERLRPVQWLGLVGIASGLILIALPT